MDNEPAKIIVAKRGPASAAQHPGPSLPAAAPGHALASLADLERAIESVDGLPELKSLHDYAAAMEHLAKQMKAVFAQSFSIAVTRLKLERKMGREISQRVKWGGSRSRLHDGTLRDHEGRLPATISKRMASRYRQIAAVPPEHFERYLDGQDERQELPTSNGLLRTWRTGRSGPESGQIRQPRRPRHRDEQPCDMTADLPPEVLDILRRVAGIGVAVDAQVPFEKVRATSIDDVLTNGCSRVFIGVCPCPVETLPRLVSMHHEGRLDEVFVAMPVAPWAAWFHRAAMDGWLCFFPARSSSMLLYLGRKVEGVCVALRKCGTTMVSRFRREMSE